MFLESRFVDQPVFSLAQQVAAASVLRERNLGAALSSLGAFVLIKKT